MLSRDAGDPTRTGTPFPERDFKSSGAPNNDNDLSDVRRQVLSEAVAECRDMSQEVGRDLAHHGRASTGQRAQELWDRIVFCYQRRCAYCGKKPDMLVRDHMFPKSRGGDDSLENIVPACMSCNSRKGARTPLEWFLGFKMRSVVVAP